VALPYILHGHGGARLFDRGSSGPLVVLASVVEIRHFWAMSANDADVETTTADASPQTGDSGTISIASWNIRNGRKEGMASAC